MFFMKETYITTAIPYVNGNPHLGHAMDYLLADVLRAPMNMVARFLKRQPSRVYQRKNLLIRMPPNSKTLFIRLVLNIRILFVRLIQITKNAAKKFGPNYPIISTKTNMRVGIVKVAKILLPTKSMTKITAFVRIIKSHTLSSAKKTIIYEFLILKIKFVRLLSLMS